MGKFEYDDSPHVGDQDNSILGNVSRFLGRPGYAVRSLLAGEPVNALENVGQFLLDLPTGGFLNRNLSLANLLPESLDAGTGDITTREERPEFTDVMKSWGMAPPVSGAGRFATDLIGGLATDPLSFLGVPAVGLGRKALAGVEFAEAAPKVMKALEETPAGLRALGDLSGAARLRRAEEVFGEALGMPPLPPDVAGPAFRFSGLGGDAGAALTSRGIEALEESDMILRSGSLRGGLPFAGPGQELMQDAWPKVKSLTAPGLFMRGLDKAHPGAAEVVRKVADDAWNDVVVKLYDKTAGKVVQGLKNVSRATAATRTLHDREASETVARLWEEVAVPERQLLGKVVRGAQDDYQKLVAEGVDHRVAFDQVKRAVDESVVEAFGSRAPQMLSKLDEYYAEMNRVQQELIDLGVWKDLESLAGGKAVKAEAAAGRLDEWAVSRSAKEATKRETDRAAQRQLVRATNKLERAEENLARGRDSVVAAQERVTKAKAEAEKWAQRDKLPGHEKRISRLRQRVISAEKNLSDRKTRFETLRLKVDEAKGGLNNAKGKAIKGVKDQQGRVEVTGGALARAKEFTDKAEEAAGEFRDTAAKARAEAAGLSKLPATNPFYIPQQAGLDVVELMARGSHNSAFMQGIRDVFTKRRKYKTVEEFNAVLKKVANEHGIPIPNDPTALMETDIGALMAKRLWAHNKTVHHVTLTNAAKKRFGYREFGREAEGFSPESQRNVEKYLQRQFAEIGDRKNWFSKFLGGSSKPIKYTNKNGETAYARWKGVNAYIKPALTIYFPAFHVRNAISNSFMAMFDKDMGGVTGAKAFLEAVRDVPIIASTKAPATVAGKFVRAIDGDASALAKLKEAEASGALELGGHAVEDVVKHLKGAVTSDVAGRADLYESLNRLDLILKTPPKVPTTTAGKALDKLAKKPLKAYHEAAMNAGNWIENSFRINGYLKLIQKGVTPTEAARRVNKVYINYGRQSAVERGIRDTIPFARFMLGVVPPAVETIARRPGTFQATLGTPVRSLGQQEGVPEEVKGTPAIPLPEGVFGKNRYLTQFGLPQEAALNAVGGLSSLEGFRKQILGGVTPPVKALLEGATDRSFFFGTDVSDYRKAPEALRQLGLAKEIEGKDGKLHYEVSPGVLQAIGATPASRFSGTLNKVGQAARGDKSALDTLLNLLSGVKTVQADDKKETRKALQKVLEAASKRGLLGEVTNYFARGDSEELPEPVKQALKDLRRLKRQQ